MASLFEMLKIERLGFAPKPSQGIRRPATEPSADIIQPAKQAKARPFLSERGLILIGTIVFCALVWGTLALWLFG